MKLILIIIASIFTISCSSQDKNLSPLDITKHFFSKEGFKEKNKYLCCEMIKDTASNLTVGQGMPVDMNRTCELIYIDSNTAVTSTEVTNKDDKINVYLYFIKDSVWKIEAIRSLKTGFIKALLDLNKIISKDSLAKMFPKLEDIDFEIGNAKLVCSTDKELIEYFKKNKNTFQNIVNLYYQNGYDKSNTSIFTTQFKNNNPDNAHEIESQLKRSFLLGIGPHLIDAEEGKKESICLIIGAMMDNAVGFMYEPDKNKVPRISKDYLIIIRNLGDGWYLYKTT